MQRRRWVGWCAAICGVPLAVPWALAADADPVLTPQPVAPGVYFVQGQATLGSAANANFIANAGFVITDEGVVVVDALGSPALARGLLAEIRRLTPLPVRFVVVTHFHADHIYGLQVFQAAGARVVGHGAARAYLASEAAQQRLAYSRQAMAPSVDADTRLVAPDQWVEGEGAVLRLGGTEFVLRSVGPSHTPEDLMVFVPSRGVLFSGDLMFRGRVPFVGEADSAGWVRALDAMIALKPAVVVPGHGPASTEPQADLALTRDYLLDLRRQMGAAARAMEPFDEAFARADWRRWQHLPLYDTAHRANAYNTYLRMEREAP